MKTFFLAIVQAASLAADIVGRVVVLGAGLFTLGYLVFCAVVAVDDYRTGRAIRKAAKKS